ncbi:opacity protein-like surface antigen [Nocardia kruczakiae]|uniref:Opacity protein-like surface antigen n=1 Tax=Nocardia kruczakiae TaxID=261477 RepID=A0ABU1XIW1_9NOCA|nr:hypothetical protein [Nocardia kruczakiae]MDR7170483.1 opacity protein-like surface antigen [Nocardia kruczakiae]
MFRSLSHRARINLGALAAAAAAVVLVAPSAAADVASNGLTAVGSSFHIYSTYTVNAFSAFPGYTATLTQRTNPGGEVTIGTATATGSIGGANASFQWTPNGTGTFTLYAIITDTSGGWVSQDGPIYVNVV